MNPYTYPQINQETNQGGNQMAGWALPVAAGISAIGSAIKGGDKQKPFHDWQARLWAKRMGRQAPRVPSLQLPGISQEATDLISRLMTGELPTGVSRALGTGAERAYGAGLSGLADIGAGPATLAGMRGDIMGRLGEQKAMLGWQGMQAGLQAAPEMSRLMMEPTKWGYAQQSQRWRDIANLYLQTPGATYAG